jgi:hypothetical protein
MHDVVGNVGEEEVPTVIHPKRALGPPEAFGQLFDLSVRRHQGIESRIEPNDFADLGIGRLAARRCDKQREGGGVHDETSPSQEFNLSVNLLHNIPIARDFAGL